MRLGIFAKTFAGHTPGEVLPAVAAAGFSAVQYNMACSGLEAMPDDIPVAAAQAVGQTASSNGVTIAALSGTYNMIHPDPAVRWKGHRRLAKLAERTAAMKTSLITLCTGTRDPGDQWHDHPENRSDGAWRDLLASMEVAIGIADRYDIYLGIEPELANVINSARSAQRLIDELKSPRIKIVLDPANLFETATLAEQRRLITEAVDMLAPSIMMGHAKDRNEAGGFTAAGQGVLDYAHYFACLRGIDFDGTIVTHGLSAGDAPRVATFLKAEAERAGFSVERV